MDICSKREKESFVDLEFFTAIENQNTIRIQNIHVRVETLGRMVKNNFNAVSNITGR